MYNFGYVIGRFQMLHKGHEQLIDSAYDQCENLLVLVGSAQEYGTVRNPFDLKTRLSMLREVYGGHPNLYIGFINDLTNENDITFDWGRYVLANVKAWQNFYGIEPKLDVMLSGNDEERMGWFDPKDVEGIDYVQLDRADIPISATQLRGYMAWNQFDLWAKHVNPLLHSYYDELRKQLFEVKS